MTSGLHGQAAVHHTGSPFLNFCISNRLTCLNDAGEIRGKTLPCNRVREYIKFSVESFNPMTAVIDTHGRRGVLYLGDGSGRTRRAVLLVQFLIFFALAVKWYLI